MAPSPEDLSDPKKIPSASSPSFPSSDLDNPFIAFRRFADSQVSSLLKSVMGLPSLFAQPDSSDRWSRVDDFIVNRREAIARARQRLIRELERDMQDSTSDEDLSDRHRGKEIQQRGAFFDPARVDPPKENREPDRPAAPMEYGKLGWDGKQQVEAKAPHCDWTEKDRDERFIVSTSEGKVNLHRVVDLWDEGQGFWIANDDPKLRSNTIKGQDPFCNPDQAVSWLLTDDYSPLYLDRTLAYKLHPSFYKSDAEDSYFRGDNQPGDLYPRFASQSIVRHDPRLSGKVNWRAAFHDLLDIHHKGDSLSASHARDRFNRPCDQLSAGGWISYLVESGSLGSQWRKLTSPAPAFGIHRFRYGVSSEAWAIPSLLDHIFVRDIMGKFPLAPFGQYKAKDDSLALISEVSTCTDNKESPRDESMSEKTECSVKMDGWGKPHPPEGREEFDMLEEAMNDIETFGIGAAFKKAAILLNRNPETEQSTLRAVGRVLRFIENPDLEDEVESILAKAFLGIDPRHSQTFEECLKMADYLLRNYHFDEWRAAKKAVNSEHPDVKVNKTETPSSPSATTSDSKSEPDSTSSSFSSLSSYSYDYDSRSDVSPTSIISTLTTVESRTLPDGRVETKRVLKKRFADGREENSESTETRAEPKDCHVVQKSMPEKPEAEISDMPTPSVVPTQHKKNSGGWFWT